MLIYGKFDTAQSVNRSTIANRQSITNQQSTIANLPMTTLTPLDTEFKRGLGLYASTMVVVGSMIGSGIFLVSAEMGRQTASLLLLQTASTETDSRTLAAALSY